MTESIQVSHVLRVLIVDDQRLLCEGFRKLIELEPDLEVVGMAGDGEGALAITERLAAAHTPPDVVLMDVRMPRLDGITATRIVKERWPEIHVVILTTFDERELIQAGLRAGAQGYVLKDISAEQLAVVIRAAAQGQVLLHPEVAGAVLASLPSSVTVSSAPSELAAATPSAATTVGMGVFAPLTEREREILSLLARGASNREISQSLFIASGTVKNHLSNIMGKLGVRDRTQAALKARELGFV
jgi:DNA-binding NarL/FixJ family response regulator